MSELKLFNTLTRNIEQFTPIDKQSVKIYCCGPTVYNYAHIGNLRTYIFEDILVKTLRYFHGNVTHVMNITDVGHLVSDADEGQDKMLQAVLREGRKSEEIANFYTEAFFKDTNALNIKKPDVICKATEHIQEMIELIQKLFDRGYAYISNGNVYFDIEKCKDYGKLAGLSLESLKSGARIEVDSSKKNPHDFALWFTKSKFENQELQWDSPWGRGYPGWHIECSAMSIKYLGSTFDIHCGGIDHIPVHHTNEIAQSECATGQIFSNVWMHGGFLVESGSQKMSKSKGEFLTLDSVISKGFDPLSYRYMCLTAHYRGELSWSWEALKGADNSLQKLVSKISVILVQANESNNNQTSKVKELEQEFKNRIGNDLNTPQVLAFLNELISDKEIISSDKIALINLIDQVLSLNLINKAQERQSKENLSNDDIPATVHELAKDRESARKSKNYKEADRLRDEIDKLGFILKDTPNGPELKRK